MDFSPYFHFNGNCEAAMKFYEKVFRGRILMMMRYSEAPTESRHGPESANLIMHARVDIGGRYLMASDAPPSHHRQPQGYSVAIAVDTPAEAERLFKELSEGGTVNMPIAETFWAERFAMLVDRFGTPWMINCEKTQPAAHSEDKPSQARTSPRAPRSGGRSRTPRK
jgi:PhnB protein